MIGKTLSHYKILEQIGAGGMGVVYRAHDERLGRDVALKLLPMETLGSEVARRALENESRSASALNHPNICTIHDVGEADGQFFVAMEYVEGESLARLIPPGGLPEEVVVRYGLQMADALAHAQERGIVHRDLKSANVVVTPEGRVKVLDFGLAQRMPKKELDVVTQSKVSLPTTGGIGGTLAYMAPETLRGEEANARSDLWALGVVLYEMAAGELPFQGATGFELSAAILHAPIRALPARVSAGLRAVIQRCLAKEPAQRYQRGGEVRAALEAIGLGPVAGPRTEPYTKLWRSVAIGSVAVGGLAALLIMFNAGGVRERLLGRPAGPPRIESIAVLPLTNMSADPAQEYFADGMTEALITELAQISGLKKVTSRTSVMLYKKNRKSMPEIAKELGVDAIIEGSVQRSGDKVGISVQLIDAAADRHLWGKAYERDVHDVLVLQREVARAIASEINVRLTPIEQTKAQGVALRPLDPKVHEAHLMGVFLRDKRTEESLKKSIEYFEQAIAIDPRYAPAYAGLASSYASLGGVLGFYSPSSYYPKARAAAERAIELDESLSEAHTVLADVRWRYDWNWPAAEREYQRALALNHSNADAHQEYGLFLEARGHFDEAVAERKQARELDPLSAYRTADVGYPLYYAGRYDEAIVYFRKALELDPNLAWGYLWMGQANLEKKKYDEAIGQIQKAIALSEGNTRAVATLGYSYAVAGNRREALKILDELKNRSRRSYVSPYFLAVLYAGLGDKESAFRSIEESFTERHPYVVLLNVEPVFRGLRSDPRFQNMLRRMNFPDSAGTP
jgi:TolB-like protein/tetratricopeptide (TPR) repeat protein